MVTLALLLVGGTTLTVGALSYERARAALAATADARLELLGRDVAAALSRKLTDHGADITTWARLETMLALTFDDVDKELAEFMRQTMGSADDYVAIVGFDATGRPVASAGDPPGGEGVLESPTRARLTLADAVDAGAGLLRFEAPVQHPRRPEERIGALVVFLDPGRLLHGVAGDRIVDDATTVTVRTPTRHVAAIAAREPVAAPPGEATDPADWIFEKRVHVPALAGITGPELLVVVQQPRVAALADVDALRATLVRIGLVVVVLSGFVGGAVAWRLSVPIRRLTAAVERVSARGRPEPLADLPAAGGEVGVLTDAFDSMLERLARSQREVISQSRLALLGEVAASIAHDVRTPLSVLKTSSQLLASPDLSDAEQRDLARMVAAEVDRVDGVVTNLVDLARPRHPQRTLEPVHAVADRVAAVLRPWARSHGVAIETQGSAALCVLLDADQMQQALLNVVHNAVQAATASGTVTIRWQEDHDATTDDGTAMIEVIDTGPGFSDEALERAFSSFFTTKSDGTGLGLAIAKRIVEAHGGQVGVRNQPGGGACVWMRLPMDAP